MSHHILSLESTTDKSFYKWDMMDLHHRLSMLHFRTRHAQIVFELIDEDFRNVLHLDLDLARSKGIPLGKTSRLKSLKRTIQSDWLTELPLDFLPKELGDMILEFAGSKMPLPRGRQQHHLHPNPFNYLCSSHCESCTSIVLEAVFGTDIREGMIDYSPKHHRSYKMWERQHFASFQHVLTPAIAYSLYDRLHFRDTRTDLHTYINSFCRNAFRFNGEDMCKSIFQELISLLFPNSAESHLTKQQFYHFKEDLQRTKARIGDKYDDLTDGEIFALCASLSRPVVHNESRKALFAGDRCRFRVFQHNFLAAVLKIGRKQKELYSNPDNLADFRECPDLYTYLPNKKLDPSQTYTSPSCLQASADPTQAQKLTSNSEGYKGGSLLKILFNGIFDGTVVDCTEFEPYREPVYYIIPVKYLRIATHPQPKDYSEQELFYGICRAHMPTLVEGVGNVSLPISVPPMDVPVIEFEDCQVDALMFESTEDGENIQVPMKFHKANLYHHHQYNYYWYEPIGDDWHQYGPTDIGALEQFYQEGKNGVIRLPEHGGRFLAKFTWTMDANERWVCDITQQAEGTGFVRPVDRIGFAVEESIRQEILMFLPLDDLINIWKKDRTPYSKLVQFGTEEHPGWALKTVAYNWFYSWDEYKAEVSGLRMPELCRDTSMESVCSNSEQRELNHRCRWQILVTAQALGLTSDSDETKQSLFHDDDDEMRDDSAESDHYREPLKIRNESYGDTLYLLLHRYNDFTKVLLCWRHGLYPFAESCLDMMIENQTPSRVLETMREHDPVAWARKYVDADIRAELEKIYVDPGSILVQCLLTGSDALARRIIRKLGFALNEQQTKLFCGVTHCLDLERHGEYTALVMAFLFANKKMLKETHVFGVICPYIATRCLTLLPLVISCRRRLKGLCESRSWHFAQSLDSVTMSDTIALVTLVSEQCPPLLVSLFEQMQQEFHTRTPKITFRNIGDTKFDELNDCATRLAHIGYMAQAKDYRRSRYIGKLFSRPNYICQQHEV